MAIQTLKRRSEFLRIRGGRRASTQAFLIEGKARPAPDPAAGVTGDRVTGAGSPASPNPVTGPRFGFTVTKKLGKAVVRNRIRRRLKAAVAETALPLADAAFDYVIVAREAALDRPFTDLKDDLAGALKRLHGTPQRKPPAAK